MTETMAELFDARLQALVDKWETPPKELVGKLPKAGTTLPYLGHAATTKALLEADPTWTWEPVALNDAGEPLIVLRDGVARMWIRLTVCGVTRLGVGSVPASAFDVEKQLIGDALRNAAMRFGVALSLWSKEEWPHDEVVERVDVDPPDSVPMNLPTVQMTGQPSAHKKPEASFKGTTKTVGRRNPALNEDPEGRAAIALRRHQASRRYKSLNANQQAWFKDWLKEEGLPPTSPEWDDSMLDLVEAKLNSYLPADTFSQEAS